ncbi:hypothetical protein OG729_20115 [Streptomyces sp. NBC_00210]|uniref:hypothetical protein n=1 Tax=Streptomyces sp. NBC_00210 TaxID=2903636 RepID=UPI003245BFE2
MNTALTVLAAGPAPVVTVPILLALLVTGIVLCTYVGHRWSTLIVGVLIGLFLTGGFAESTKTIVSETVISVVSGISASVG